MGDEAGTAEERQALKQEASDDEEGARLVAQPAVQPVLTCSSEHIDGTQPAVPEPKEDAAQVAPSPDKSAYEIDRSLSQTTNGVYDSPYEPLISGGTLNTPQKPPRSTLLRKVPSKPGVTAAAAVQLPTTAAPAGSPPVYQSEDSGSKKDKTLLTIPDAHFSGAGSAAQRKRRAPALEFFKNRWILIGILSALFLILIIVIVAITVTRKPRPVPTKPEIKAFTGCGHVLGVIEDGVYVFKGIPYTNPMVGNRRWTYSKLKQELMDCFNDSYPALDFKGPCMQGARFGTDPKIIGSEDCLYLNVWTPALPVRTANGNVNASALRPVFVYVHGGFLRYGSGHMEPTRPTALLSKELDAVIVSFNYRLNVFGFLSLKTLREESQNEFGSGNYGLWDQIVALTWIKDNIEGFGGNPNMVTVAGLDGGATSLYALLASEHAKGLFRAAWLSGGAVQFPVTAEQAHNKFVQLSWVDDCKRSCAQSGTSSCEAQCLRNTDADHAWMHSRLFAMHGDTMDIPLSTPAQPTLALAIVDGYIIPTKPSSEVLSRVHIPLLLGTNSHETDYKQEPPASQAQMCPFVLDNLRAHSIAWATVDELKLQYPCNETDPRNSGPSVYVQMASDIRFTCPYNSLAQSAGAAKVYRYVSTVAPPVPTDYFGVGHKSSYPTHGLDIIAFFGNNFDVSDAEYRQYQQTVRGIVKTFIRGGSLEAAYNMTTGSNRTSILSGGSRVEQRSPAYGAERCQTWRSVGLGTWGWLQ